MPIRWTLHLVAPLVMLLMGCSAGGSSNADRRPDASPDSSASTSAPGDPAPSRANRGVRDATPAIAAAADAFLATLSAQDRDAVMFDFGDSEQRQRWSNLPADLYDRAGLRWGDLGADSRTAWLSVMRATLSGDGYARVRGAWLADDALAQGQGGGGSGLTFGRDHYWIALIGAPSQTEPWQWQFGGHHVTINATIQGPDVALTPSFIGVQPAVYTDVEGRSVEPLSDIRTDALDLVSSLRAPLRDRAVLGATAIDVVLGPGQDGRTLQDQGVRGADLDAAQRARLLSLLTYYASLLNEEDAARRVEQLEADLDDTHFAWYGPTDSPQGVVYFRVTAPRAVVEYSNQSGLGTAHLHVHGVYRDPTNDYGEAFGAGLR